MVQELFDFAEENKAWLRVVQMWELRYNHTTYDACYLALAETMTAPLFTCDHKLANDAHAAEVRVLPRTH